MPKINRRDFLKIYTALLASATLSGAAPILASTDSQAAGKPNILVFVFDAMSAQALSLYGYPRQTTPNLEKFAERASVYHQHYSAGNFTTAGTASMLTGMYPWTHRAFNYRGMINRGLVDRNLFHLLGNEYKRFAFTQNLWADILLSQFEADLDMHLRCDTFSQVTHSLFQPDDVRGDRAMAYYVFQDFLNLRTLEPHPFPGSLFIASAELSRALSSNWGDISTDYPRGLPTNYDFSYKIESVLEGVGRFIRSIKVEASPYLGYFHFWSPHGPYNARKDFIGIFPDELKLPSKPHHPLAGDNFSQEQSQEDHRKYDECIAEVDAEFGRVISNLETSGVLQNSYVIVTSDHGELFERGEIGHASALMYAPVTHIPLLISAPGQQARSDFYSLTSNLDLLPTLLQIAGKEIPHWVEGTSLPGFGGTPEASRSIFSMIAKDNAAFRAINHATFTMIKDAHELFFFTGYPNHPDAFELYNLAEDAEELHDLFSKDITTASRMKDELLEAVNAANRNYPKK
ncbi:MAG TPA: sulfatase-like hydrolase/transferase [Anaerolineales bacterium]|nr:sulfatase-like hydrolase/transferase [Anaerolineales bacterium]